MRISNSHTLTSLLTAFLFVVAFMLTGCSADTLTGPVLDSETTIQANGDGTHNNFNGDGTHNNKGDGTHNDKGDGTHNNKGDGTHNN